MRGGITSGIVYPRAIAKLAETYRFRSIGGTSAGAIAAAGTAAAAYGAKHGEGHFETRFKQLPEELATVKGGKSVLERLFQPQAETRRLFKVLMSGLRRECLARKLGRIGGVLCVNYWPYAAAGAVLALLPLSIGVFALGASGWAVAGLIVASVIPVLVLTLVAAAIGAGLDLFNRLPENNYGLCSGSSNGEPDEAGVLPLTDWLHDFFQSVAKRPLDRPVTFGDLWNEERDENAARDIELVLMTTNVTRGISQRLPFIEGSWGQLFFNESEFRALFPASLVDWMIGHAQAPTKTKVIVPEGFHGLPKPADLPILLGARMSLSFPFLLGAVPLHAADVTIQQPDGKVPLVKCWFSDGGLTSNFPLHFFDAPLPTRPTFGINLVPAAVKMAETDDADRVVTSLASSSAAQNGADAWDRIYMPSKNFSGISSAARFNRFRGILGFFSALFDTARNWADTELTAMPGYRDRIVHVALTEDEGGLDLNMPKNVIETIGERGERAGELLAARFKPTPKGSDRVKDPKTGKDVDLTWDNHRWICFRSFTAALELALRRLTRTWADSAAETRWRSYQKLLERGDDFPTSYRFGNEGQIAFAKAAMEQLVTALAGWEGDKTFDRGAASREGGAPRPKPVLRMMPPGSNDPRAERPGTPDDGRPAV